MRAMTRVVACGALALLLVATVVRAAGEAEAKAVAADEETVAPV